MNPLSRNPGSTTGRLERGTCEDCTQTYLWHYTVHLHTASDSKTDWDFSELLPLHIFKINATWYLDHTLILPTHSKYFHGKILFLA